MQWVPEQPKLHKKTYRKIKFKKNSSSQLPDFNPHVHNSFAPLTDVLREKKNRISKDKFKADMHLYINPIYKQSFDSIFWETR